MRDEDDRKFGPQHQLGERVDDLSIAELDLRVALLRAEIARLEAMRTAKQAAAAAATSFFKS